MTDSFAHSAASRQAEIDRRRERLIANWPDAWRRMTQRWRCDEHDAVWLLYSANYLLRTGGVRWAIDPATLRNLVPEAQPVSLEPLAGLRFILLTHSHSDHVDRDTLRAIAAMDDVRWVVPRHMLTIAESCGAPASRIIVPQPLEPLTFDGLRLTVFEGLHWEYPDRWGEGEPVAGTEAVGCLAEWGDRRVLFPGDTRTYDPAGLPALGPVDTLFAHVWLGRGAALASDPPALDALCDFVTALQPTERVLLTHLWQVAREPDDYWDQRHARQVRDGLLARRPELTVQTPDFWGEIAI